MKQDTLDISYSLDTIDNAAQKLWTFAKGHRIWTFSGDMGAGKTTLISSLCRLLGVEETVSSPTFSLINEYHFRNQEGAGTIILHMDWYRINGTAEAIDAGMEDALQGQSYCFIEWP
jgi:tRNA threonylcarbamoyladenosine biosynthesis protein TsaE